MKIIVLFLFILSNTSFASNVMEKYFFLKSGPSIASTSLETLNTENDATGLSLISHVGIRYFNFEFNITSYIYVGLYDRESSHDDDGNQQAQMEASGSKITGEGAHRSFSIGPTVRYTFDYTIKKKWRPSFFLGPMYSLQDFIFNNALIDGGDYQKGQKITVETHGGIIGAGLHNNHEEYYIEFIYAFSEGNDLAVVGGNKRRRKILSKEYSSNNMRVKTYMINVGFMIF